MLQPGALLQLPAEYHGLKVCIGPVTQSKLSLYKRSETTIVGAKRIPTKALSAIQAGLQPTVCWHQHQTTKPLDLRAISEI